MLVLVHGGAASVPPALIDEKMAQLRKAAKKGFLCLVEKCLSEESPSASLDAIQTAVLHMEDSPYFNAGFGSSLTSTGMVEMDSIIVDGRSLDFGAVSCITDYRNPVSIARAVMEKSDHCLFTSEGAHDFAAKNGFSAVKRSALVHEMAMVILAVLEIYILSDHLFNCFI